MDFGDNFDQPEVDPAAEFLAREQSALAGLEDELPPTAAAQPEKVKTEDNGTLESSESFEMINNIESHEQTNANDDSNDFEISYRSAKPPMEEPEKIKKWREDQKKRLEEKDRDEEKKKEELKVQAKKELEDWYKQHEESITKTKSSNRESAKNAEKNFVAESTEIEPGTEWERIAKLCDFNPKASKTSRDVSRMRSIILQLKQNPVAIKRA
ncbi:clathrin light chain isoform X2 [Phlebotomus argentipes]|uniref:clathrin light chain isoform X2 n=1 Tax=Phlebotomus argentipes TaxID=94469 RepID=UPI002892D8D5|nr:clathrin light chain isoform X2 [Phlebotomus argentipes]